MAEKKKTEAPAPPPIATTYYPLRKDGKWRIMRVDVAGDGTMKAAQEFEHPSMLVASDRLRVLLDRVLP